MLHVSEVLDTHNHDDDDADTSLDNSRLKFDENCIIEKAK
jgi:hypothetical protein